MPLIAVGGGNGRRDPPRQRMEGRPVARIEPASLAPGFSPPVAASLVSNGRLAVAVALGIALVAGLVTSLLAPRGPTTTANALFVMAVGLLLGTAGGALVRPRWGLAALSVVYVVGIETARLDVVASSLDVRLDIPYGIVAFVLARGLHLLLALPPLVLGVLMGRALARRLGWTPNAARQRLPIGSLMAGLVVACLAILVAWPASTPPVLGPNGLPAAGGIAELAAVRLGGVDQAVMIRAADPDKPVLLYLSGGPGQSDLGSARALLEPLAADFVLAVWDQRGSGTSYAALDPTASVTLEQAVADTIELSEHLRDRFGEHKIYLLGESWGTTLGVLAAQARPDLFHAYIGSGQMVSLRETDRIIWRDLLAYADRTGDGAMYEQVLSLGEPPYRDMPWANSVVLGYYPLLEAPYAPPAAYIERGNGSGIGPFGVLASEYAFIDKANVIRGLIDMFSLMYPQLQDVDFRTDVPALEVPVYVLDGAHELAGRRVLAHEWFEGLTAPHKELITYENAGHSVVFEEADAFHRLMTESIVPATYRN
jgi:proline iminopeptidase